MKVSNKERGPFLARLEMHKKMRQLNLDADTLLGDYQDLLVEYFRIFGNKKCCVNDLKMFLEHLDVSRRAELASKLIQDTGISSTTLPQNVIQNKLKVLF
jgi:N-terminal acetyltransferase B complex non-catalytic subunit